MARGKKSEEMLTQVRRDRLNKHLNEVEELIQEWITDLNAPHPFLWIPSDESAGVTGTPVRPPEYFRLEPWKLWACRSVYVPRVEQDIASNHVLRKHLRKRVLWKHHADWEQRLNRIRELGIPICERAAEMENECAKGRELTEDFKAIALLVALELPLGHAPEKSYSQRGTRGVCYADVLIEKSADAQQMSEVVKEHWQMISRLGQLKQMLELAREWQQVLVLQDKMKGLAQKAVKSSDILYPCQFCRRLWGE
jgi:hypothetical protein